MSDRDLSVTAPPMPDGICNDCYLGQHRNCIGSYVNAADVTTKCVCEDCETEACERCMGVGTVEKTIGIQWLEITCEECDGTGRVAAR